jgi:hypothetical protein
VQRKTTLGEQVQQKEWMIRSQHYEESAVEKNAEKRSLETPHEANIRRRSAAERMAFKRRLEALN